MCTLAEFSQSRDLLHIYLFFLHSHFAPKKKSMFARDFRSFSRSYKYITKQKPSKSGEIVYANRGGDFLFLLQSHGIHRNHCNIFILYKPVFVSFFINIFIGLLFFFFFHFDLFKMQKNSNLILNIGISSNKKCGSPHYDLQNSVFFRMAS